jgi:pyruvate/2-oxoglutarate dehydrogenase complex dihydrolipoamide acyltransferase (E2) component
MARLYNVRVRADYRWPRVRVSGREFSTAGEVINGALLNEEMRASPLLEIEAIPEPAPEPEGVDATNAARELAAEHGVDLAEVAGSGEEGRVLVDDVRAVIEGVGDAR